jgi:hypothetical protein
VLILLSLHLFACRSPSPAADEPRAQGPDRPPPAAPTAVLPSRGEFVNDGLRTRANDREQLRASLGAPDSVGEEVLPNRHVPGVLDTIFTVHYSDLLARIHHPGGGSDLLSMVQVSDNRHLRYPVIGMRVEAIDRAFGQPDEASDSSLTYYCQTCEAGDDPVQLVIVDGTVRRVRFNYYVD